MHATETALIVLPLPPRVLSPNCPPGTRGGRFARYRASAKYKSLAKSAAESLQISDTWQKATIKATFYHKTYRRRDDVNHLAMLKAAYDGIVQSGLLFDDDSTHLVTLPPTFLVDRENPRVELLVTKVYDKQIVNAF